MLIFYISQMQAHICGVTTMENHDNTTTMKAAMPVAMMVAEEAAVVAMQGFERQEIRLWTHNKGW
jgi:hypothetical protein